MPRTELRTEVEIQAPAPVVFRVLTDFARYPEWNPFLTRVEGKLEVGTSLSLDLSLPEGSSYTLAPRLERFEPDAELRWRAQYLAAALLEAEHFFQLSAADSGATRLVHGQNFSGFLLRFAAGSLTLAARGAVYMNQALKKRAESTR